MSNKINILGILIRMKRIVALLVMSLGISRVSASSCVDISKNLVRGQESSVVTSLQKFLSEKGFLKATPNGYFGGGHLLQLNFTKKV